MIMIYYQIKSWKNDVRMEGLNKQKFKQDNITMASGEVETVYKNNLQNEQGLQDVHVLEV
jgi:hypothetical protein